MTTDSTEGDPKLSFTDDADILIKALDEYLRESAAGEKPVIDQKPIQSLIDSLGLEKHLRDGGLSGERLSEFLKKYLASTTRLHHPGYLAHQVAVPHYSGALGALIDGFTNNPMAIYEMGPAAAAIEFFVVNRLLEKVGWTPTPVTKPDNPETVFGGGVLTHGGSLANLTALVAARSRLVPDVWQEGSPSDLALLAPDGCHYSVARAAGILGLGQKAVYPLEVDDRGVVRPDRLEEVYEKLRLDSRRALALVANACSTAVGLYDPLPEIGRFCQKHGIWFHVDGAHGAGALLSSKHRGLMAGVEHADSMIWDAHKMMRTPTLCAAILVKDHRDLDRAFQQEASYLFHEKNQPGFDFIHRTVECTKAGLGLRLFMVMAGLGERGLEEYLDRQCALAREAYDYIQSQPDFECAVEPQSNILCFRTQGEDNWQLALRDRLTSQGNFYISTTAFMNRRYLRLVFMNPATSLEDVKTLIREIRSLEA